jgi:hypothetical protein
MLNPVEVNVDSLRGRVAMLAIVQVLLAMCESVY